MIQFQRDPLVARIADLERRVAELERNGVTVTPAVTHNATRNAERQRRYREHKKASGDAG